MALHGAVRGTVDVDLVIRLTKADFIAAERALKKIGLVPRLPVGAEQVFDFREEYRKNRNLVSWSFYNPSEPTEIVDVVITHDLKQLKVVRVQLGRYSVNVLTVDSLIAMKRESARPQDLEDIRALETLKK